MRQVLLLTISRWYAAGGVLCNRNDAALAASALLPVNDNADSLHMSLYT